MKPIDMARDFLKVVQRQYPTAEDIEEAIEIQKLATFTEPKSRADCTALIAILAFDLEPLIVSKGLTACLRSIRRKEEEV